MTWSSKEQFEQGSQDIRKQLQCTPLPVIPKRKDHIKDRNKGEVNCTRLVELDFEYRQIMKMDPKTYKMLYNNDQWSLPDHMGDSGLCRESTDELERVVETFKAMASV